jgi:hypothetical protein
MSVGLVALSASAIAGPDEAAHGGGVGRYSERKADTGTVAPPALAPPVDSDTARCFNTLPRPARSFLSSAEHGLRSMGACSGNKFMILQIAPAGQAVLASRNLIFPSAS